MKHNKIKKLNNGFSLMETLIWVGIVGIFIGIVGIAGMGLMERTKVQAARQELNVYSAALLSYYQTEGEFPSDDEGLNILISENYIDTKGNKSAAVDPWNQEYIYTLVNDGQGFIIKSLGADKREGGSGTKKDVIITSGNDNESLEDTEIDFTH